MEHQRVEELHLEEEHTVTDSCHPLRKVLHVLLAACNELNILQMSLLTD